MPSNTVPNLSQAELKTLLILLCKYGKHKKNEKPLEAQIINVVAGWVKDDIVFDVPDRFDNFIKDATAEAQKLNEE